MNVDSFFQVMSAYAVYKCNTLRGLSEDEAMRVASLQQSLRLDETNIRSNGDILSRLNQTLFSLIETRNTIITRYDQMFDCYLTNRFTQPGAVRFDACLVDTTDGAMEKRTGTFTVNVEGIYQLSFTAKYVSSSKGRFGAWSDIMVNDTVIADSQREYNGNHRSNSESSTHTILVLYPLRIGDQVKVIFNRDGDSYIHSDRDRDVHFTGRRVAAIPDIAPDDGEAGQ